MEDRDITFSHLFIKLICEKDFLPCLDKYCVISPRLDPDMVSGQDDTTDLQYTERCLL